MNDNTHNYLSLLPGVKGRYIALDTETTGLDVKTDFLICISAVELIDGKLTGIQFNAYLRKRDLKNNNNNPCYFIEDYSDDIYECEKHTLINFCRFVGESIIFTHNSYFDYKFIDKAFKTWGLETIPYDRYRCTIKICKYLIPEFNKKKCKYNLEIICNYFNIKNKKNDFHHGLFDAFICGRILIKLFELAEKNIEKENIEKLIKMKSNENYNNNEIIEIINHIDQLKLEENNVTIYINDQQSTEIKLNETIYMNDLNIEEEIIQNKKDDKNIKIKSLMKDYLSSIKNKA